MGQQKKPVNPKYIPFVSTPFFILGVLLAAMNWRRLGYPERARNAVKWGIIGLVLVLIIASYFPADILKKMWSVGVGINVGTGMALKTLQMPEYTRAVEGAE